MNEQIYQDASKLVYNIWKGIDFNSMNKHRMFNIYSELEGKIKSSACTSKLEMFYSKLCSKLGSSIVWKHNKDTIELLNKYSENKIFLDTIRNNTNIIILYLKELIERDKKNIINYNKDIDDKSFRNEENENIFNIEEN